ncbi:hypothetical protein V6N13_142121 [Hibiscus sabdariffa]
MSNTTVNNNGGNDGNRIHEDLLWTIERLMRPMEERLQQCIEEAVARTNNAEIGPQVPIGGNDYYSQSGGRDTIRGSNNEGRPRRPRQRRPRVQEQVDDNLSNIRIAIPPFQGKSDPEAYLEWEKKVELVFECHNYSEAKKVRLVAIEFSDYAIIWCDKLTSSRRRNGEPPIETWNEMKATM